MSVPPPATSSGGNPLKEFVLRLEAARTWKRRRAGDDVLRLSALGAVLECDRLLREPLRLPLGVLQMGLVERGSEDAEGRFPVLKRLSATAVVPREHGVEGWLWTRDGGSALTVLGDEELAPNGAVLFSKPLGDDSIAAALQPEALEELAARSPLGAPAIYGLLLRLTDPSAAETVFRRFGLLRPLTDRDVGPALRRSLPSDRPADPAYAPAEDRRAATSVAPPGAR